jgi:hypothetical protein
MAHKCFISFKTEDQLYKNHIQYILNVDMVDKSLNAPIDSNNDDYVMRQIRENYLRDSTVTIFLIGSNSSDALGSYEQRFIKWELQASLYNGVGNTRNGVLGVVLPHMYDKVFTGDYTCHCGKIHNGTQVYAHTIKEFSHNYFIPDGAKCGWTDDERYCILIKWDTFVGNPEYYINQAFNKRSHPIANKVLVRP